jgi:hypothetical protein
MDGNRTWAQRARAAFAMGLAGVLTSAAPALADGPNLSPDQQLAAGEPAMQAAVGIAKAYWSADPCGGQVGLSWGTLDSSTNATSTWSNPESQFGLSDLNASCAITLNRAVPWDWAKFCTIVVHEYGHLDGRPHVDDPNDVMYAYYVKPVDPCAAAAAGLGFQPASPPAPLSATEQTALAPASSSSAASVKGSKKKVVARETVRVKRTHGAHAKRTKHPHKAHRPAAHRHKPKAHHAKPQAHRRHHAPHRARHHVRRARHSHHRAAPRKHRVTTTRRHP